MQFALPRQRGVPRARQPRLLRVELQGLPPLPRCLHVNQLRTRATQRREMKMKARHEPRAEFTAVRMACRIQHSPSNAYSTSSSCTRIHSCSIRMSSSSSVSCASAPFEAAVARSSVVSRNAGAAGAGAAGAGANLSISPLPSLSDGAAIARSAARLPPAPALPCNCTGGTRKSPEDRCVCVCACCCECCGSFGSVTPERSLAYVTWSTQQAGEGGTCHEVSKGVHWTAVLAAAQSDTISTHFVIPIEGCK